MKRQVVKWVLIVCCTVMMLVGALLVFLVADFPGHASDHLVRKAMSPDGQFIAELHEIVTPMHGGPDMLEVTLRPKGNATGDIVYSRNFECGPDYSGYQLHWNGARSLTVVYGACDAGRYHSAVDNSVSQQVTVWREVKINYERSNHIARAEP